MSENTNTKTEHIQYGDNVKKVFNKMNNAFDRVDESIEKADNVDKALLDAKTNGVTGETHETLGGRLDADSQLIKDLDEKVKEDVSSLSASVDKTVQAINDRVNNLITQNNPTEGNSELQDIRLGADEVTYPSAGEAVRQQMDEKVSKPEEDGTEGQVLSRDSEGNIVWRDGVDFIQRYKNVYSFDFSSSSSASKSESFENLIAFIKNEEFYVRFVQTDKFESATLYFALMAYYNYGVHKASENFLGTSLTKFVNSDGVYETLYKFSKSEFESWYDRMYLELTTASDLAIDNCYIVAYCGQFRAASAEMINVINAYGSDFIEYNDMIMLAEDDFVYLIKQTVKNENGDSNTDFSTLSNKYSLHIGDSYTAAMAGTGGVFDTLSKSLGMSGALNYGIVSSTIRDKGNNLGYAYKPMVCRVLNTPSEDTSGSTPVSEGEYVPLDRDDIGYITFMGGTNDSYSYESSIGTDILDGTKYHIYGAVNLILQKLVASYPGVPILVILQPSRANISYDDNNSPEGVDISSLDNIMKSVLVSQRKQKVVKEVAELYVQGGFNVHIIDCCFDWYSPLNASDLSNIWSSDKLHLTPKGYSEITNGTKYNSVLSTLKEIFQSE